MTRNVLTGFIYIYIYTHIYGWLNEKVTVNFILNLEVEGFAGYEQVSVTEKERK
jgi:hypothetical protein